MGNQVDARWGAVPTIRSEVIYLEMTADPHVSAAELGESIVERVAHPEVASYLDIYRAVGRDYLWNYRPGQTHAEIEAILRSPGTWLYLLRRGTETIGMAELDATDPANIELVHFGLVPDVIQRGIGRRFLQEIIHTVWATKPHRMWLSTCGLDHPKAVQFYEKAGFRVFKRTEGEFKDWRFTGFYALTDAPRIPLAQRPD